MTSTESYSKLPLPIPAAAAGGDGYRPPAPPVAGLPVPFSKDLLRGAEEIAEFLYGSRTLRRKVYHLAETSNLPVFRLGSMLCARRSVLISWVEEQEKRGMGEFKQ